jgi:hypothetical protein
MQTQPSVQGLKQLSHELVAELLHLKEYGCLLPRSILVYGATREVTAMVTEAIKHELVDQRGIKAIVRSECVPPSSSEGDYCIDIGYFLGAHRRTPPLLGTSEGGRPK